MEESLHGLNNQATGEIITTIKKIKSLDLHLRRQARGTNGERDIESGQVSILDNN